MSLWGKEWKRGPWEHCVAQEVADDISKPRMSKICPLMHGDWNNDGVWLYDGGGEVQGG